MEAGEVHAASMHEIDSWTSFSALAVDTAEVTTSNAVGAGMVDNGVGYDITYIVTQGATINITKVLTVSNEFIKIIGEGTGADIHFSTVNSAQGMNGFYLTTGGP